MYLFRVSLANTMLSKGDKVNLTIDTLSSDGQGIAHYNGMAVFVPFALPGESAVVRITKATSSYAMGEAESLSDFSPERHNSECPVYGRCGGCDLMHLNYEAQLCFKRRQVKNALERIGGFRGVEVKPVIGMANPWNYRNKAVFSFTYSQNKVVFGCIERKSHNVIPVSDCKIQFPEAISVMNAVTDWANKFNIPPYNSKLKTGVLRHALIRKTHEGIMLVIVAAGSLPHKNELIKKLTETPFAIPVCSVIHNINAKDTSLITGKEYFLLYGKERLTENIGGLEFSVSAESFLQINPVQTEKLYKLALDGIKLSPSDNVIDLYCGIGTLSLLAAKRVNTVTGIEFVQTAVNDAKRNARLNGITNAKFICGNVETVLPKLIKNTLLQTLKTKTTSGNTADLKAAFSDERTISLSDIPPENSAYSALILDPPRAGADKRALQAVIESNIPRVAYVSCDPATLARDCKLLCSNGYQIVSVQPVDMFPQTHHVETVVLLSV